MAFAKKSLGQNFLISQRIVDMIAKAGNITPGEVIVEIGPGKGVLTRALLSSGARVKAVEKDDRLIPLLKETFGKEIEEGNFDLIHGDILQMDTDALLSSGEPYKIIANIPYYITGALIRTFLSSKQKPSSMILMVQKEVADRIIARNGKESILSLSVKAYAKPELVVNVARGNFFPIPNVDSAVIKISEIHSPFSTKEEEVRFFELVKKGFSQKRKKFVSNISSLVEKEKTESFLESRGIEKGIRAEDLALTDWLALAAI